MSCTPLPKAAKQVCANQLTRLPCLVVHVQYKFVYTTTSEIGGQLLLAFTSFNFVLGRGSEKVCYECLGVSNAFPVCHLCPNLVNLECYVRVVDLRSYGCWPRAISHRRITSRQCNAVVKIIIKIKANCRQVEDVRN